MEQATIEVFASGRSSPMGNESDTETDTGWDYGPPGVGDAGDAERTDTDLEQDAHCPETPGTADILTEEPFQQYHYRLDDFGPQEKDWFEQIKMCESVDEVDANIIENNLNHQVSKPPWNQTTSYPNLPATDTFGRLYFEREEEIGAYPVWFIRVAVTTPQDVVQGLLEKFEVINRKSKPLRIHCIDYDRWPDTEEQPSEQPQPVATKKDMDGITLKLQKDLWSMCQKTAGIVLTWSGLGGENLVHQALGGIIEDSRHTKTFATNLAAIATPPWAAVDLDVRRQLKGKGATVHLNEAGTNFPHTSTPLGPSTSSSGGETKTIFTQREPLGKQISPYASHFLMVDDDLCTADEILNSDTQQKSNFRHFHYQMIKAMETYEKQKESSEMPVVCILFNGYHDALKMVVFALDEKIPVLVVKGSGGYADIIANVYMQAHVENTKTRDETGHVCTRNTKKPGSLGDDYLKSLKDERSKHQLKKIFDHLDYLTVYIPAVSVQTLDSVIFEALLKHKQEAKFSGLVDTMQQLKKTFQHQQFLTETGSFLESDELQMDFFIEALKQNSVDVVKVFLNKIQISKKFMQNLHMGRVLRLYVEDTGKEERLIDFRQKLRKLLKKLPMFPLRCRCDGCPNCDVTTNTKSREAELEVQRTCLHPIQELFLWTLHAKRLELAIVFWERCDDKIAAALVAQIVFHYLAKESRDPDVKWQMEQNIKHFQSLAIQMLKNCHQMDEIQTELLLTKPCPWWGDMSVLQLAIMTCNKEFMTQTACKNIMTRIWKGEPPSDPGHKPGRPCQLVDINPDPSCCGRRTCSPRSKYLINFVCQMVFLGLFSYALLSDLGHGITPIFIFLIIWVAAVTVEEFRQLLSRDPVISNFSSTVRGRLTFKQKCHSYLSQFWNRMDVMTILLFWFGLFVFVPIPWMHVIGRFLLSIDIFFFFMRTFQMLMVFDELGLMLVMVYKMAKDTRNFMIILLIFVLAYAVSSESLLYPESDMTLERLFHLPRKAYWQVFGELNLEEIEYREKDQCASGNNSKHYGYDTPHCPTKYGSYIVPILLGLHVMITNVLLLNLLIARFGVTFNKVHDEACEHQSWHRCQIITEFYSRTSLPAPFNILHGIVAICRFVLIKIGRCCQSCCQVICCRRRQNRHQAHEGDGTALSDIGGATGSAAGGDNVSALGNGDSDQRRPLMGGVTVRWSADRRSMDVFWDNGLPLASNGTENQLAKNYRVEVAINGDQGQMPPPPDTYEVAMKPTPSNSVKAMQALAVWDLAPSCDYTVMVENIEATKEPTKSSHSKDDLLDILHFEEDEAGWVRRQEDAEDPIFKELRERTESLKLEMGKITGDMKTNYDSLKKDVSRTGDEVTSHAENLNELLKSSKRNRKSFKKIDLNLDKLSKFLDSTFRSVTEEAESIRKRALEASEEKDKAKSEREDAQKETASAEKEKENALEEAKLAHRVLGKAQEELNACKSDTETAWTQVKELTKALEEQKQLQTTMQRQLQTFKEEQQQHIQDLIHQQQQLQQQLTAQEEQLQMMQQQQQQQLQQQLTAQEEQLQTMQQQQQQQLQQQLTAQEQQLQIMQQQQQQQIQSVLSQISRVAEAVCPSPAVNDGPSE